MSSELLLHIGYPKAASTSLQRSVFPELESHGIEYLGMFPTEEGASTGNDAAMRLLDYVSQRVAQQAGNDPLPFSEVTGKKETGRNRILSHEGFLNLSIRRKVVLGRLTPLDPFAIAKALHRVVSGLKCRILIITRRQDEMLLSLYAQSYTHFYRRVDGLDTLAGFLGNLKSGSAYEHIFEALYYDDIVSEYQRLFGSNNVAVLPFELLVNDESRFLSELASVVGVDTIDAPVSKDNVRRLDDGGKISKRMDLYEMGFRCLKRYASEDSLVWRALRPMRGLVSPLKSVRAIASRKFQLTAQQRELILERFAETNRALSERVNLELDRYGYWR
jgi:hypothetical protein